MQVKSAYLLRIFSHERICCYGRLLVRSDRPLLQRRSHWGVGGWDYGLLVRSYYLFKFQLKNSLDCLIRLEYRLKFSAVCRGFNRMQISRFMFYVAICTMSFVVTDPASSKQAPWGWFSASSTGSDWSVVEGKADVSINLSSKINPVPR
jgi:hypothetical protein